MDSLHPVNLDDIADDLRLDRACVQTVVELLDEGNTVPFITRFRKDKTGGLDERQIRAIQGNVVRQRQLVERRQTVLKSIESQQRLTDKLRALIESTRTAKQLEDIYLPYKPKKKTLATMARQRGLEPFAKQIIDRDPLLTDLDSRAKDFLDPEKELTSVEEVLLGVGHLVAEHIGERADLREPLRNLLWKEGVLTSKRLERPDEMADESAADSDDIDAEDGSVDAEQAMEGSSSAETDQAALQSVVADCEAEVNTPADNTPPADATTAEPLEAAEKGSATESPAPPEPTAFPESPFPESLPATNNEPVADPTLAAPTSTGSAVSEPTRDNADESSCVTPATSESRNDAPLAKKPAGSTADTIKLATATSRRIQRREARKRKRDKLEQSFKDYFDFRESVTKVRHHRILAINRGERTKVLRVKIEAPAEKGLQQLEAVLELEDHPHADFVRRNAQDALNRLLLPSLEREVRRELTDRAEEHAVDVFARNLRALLLQPPIRGKRVLALDPGFRSGCKLVALDEFGNVLGDTLIHLIGKADRTKLGRQRLVEMVKTHNVDVLTVGNGTACRESERLVADVLENELAGQDIGYVIVNEAGASIYSTSNAGREEHPNLDPTVRSAISIGRRTLDPLSELVKIDAASIGVGLYQHDVKSKHLRESLDAVVESCVNYVGVDVNSASPALLSRVSGLNQLTARRIYEYRQQNGPFLTRHQLMEVPGIGETTFVQAAGFLKVVGGENPLDGTWIHPESYDVANRVLQAIDSSVEQLRPAAAQTLQPPAAPDATESSPVEPKATASTEASSSAATADNQLSVESTGEAPSSASTEASATEASPTEALPTEAPSSEGSPTEGSPTEALPTGAPSSEVSDEAPSGASTTTDEAASRTSVKETGPNTDHCVSPEVAAAADAPGSPAIAEPRQEKPPNTSPLSGQLAEIDVDALSGQLGVGRLLLQDILAALSRPGRDPREDLPPPVFRHGILKLEDLKPGMELSGTVLNVVDFGAFVDIGMNDSGLVHVSRLADSFVSDPHEVVSVGDVLRVWVIEVDNQRRRVSLTAIQPGTEKPRPPKRGKKPAGQSPERPPKKRPPGPPKGKGRRTAAHAGQKGGKRWQHKAKAKPKPVVPITPEMAEGKEPMRTFGDLKQFFEKQVTEPESTDESAEAAKKSK